MEIVLLVMAVYNASSHPTPLPCPKQMKYLLESA